MGRSHQWEIWRGEKRSSKSCSTSRRSLGQVTAWPVWTSGQVPSSSVSPEGPGSSPVRCCGPPPGRPWRAPDPIGWRSRSARDPRPSPRDLLAFFERQHPLRALPRSRTHTAKGVFDSSKRHDPHAERSCDSGAVKAGTEQRPGPVLRGLVQGSSFIRREPLRSPLEFHLQSATTMRFRRERWLIGRQPLRPIPSEKGDRWALGLAVRYLAIVLAALVRRGGSIAVGHLERGLRRRFEWSEHASRSRRF